MAASNVIDIVHFVIHIGYSSLITRACRHGYLFQLQSLLMTTPNDPIIDEGIKPIIHMAFEVACRHKQKEIVHWLINKYTSIDWKLKIILFIDNLSLDTETELIYFVLDICDDNVMLPEKFSVTVVNRLFKSYYTYKSHHRLAFMYILENMNNNVANAINHTQSLSHNSNLDFIVCKALFNRVIVINFDLLEEACSGVKNTDFMGALEHLYELIYCVTYNNNFLELYDHKLFRNSMRDNNKLVAEWLIRKISKYSIITENRRAPDYGRFVPPELQLITTPAYILLGLNRETVVTGYSINNVKYHLNGELCYKRCSIAFKNEIKKETKETCIICYDKNEELNTSCGHSYCVDCLKTWINRNDKSNVCPYCKQNMDYFVKVV